MGITYKAIDMNLGCPVALKIINARSLAGSAARERLLKEARTAARLRHLNIASIFHLGLDDENCYYSMEYIEGETLECFVCRVGKLPAQTALDIVQQIARALRVAHEQQFIHRDIKPSNIMVVHGDFAAELIVKVIDFGLVKALSEEGLAGDWSGDGYFAGTPFYASPEQLAAGAADARSDIYSLGKCLCFMLTGQLPAEQPLPLGNSLRRKQGEMVDVPDHQFTQPVNDLLRSMLAVDPASRPQGAGELLQRVQGCRAALENRPAYTQQTLWIGCTVAIVSAIVLVFGWLNLHHAARRAENSAVTAESKLLYARGDDLYYGHSKANNQRAIDLYSAAIAKSPGFADAHAGLACAYFQQYGRYEAHASYLDAAVVSAQRAISLDPHRPRGFVAMGVIRTVQGRHWEALAQFRRALALDPRYYQAMTSFSIGWSLVGRPQLGLPWSLAATQIEPFNTGAWMSAAEACVDLCDDEQAEKFYRRCLDINPGWISGHCGLMHLHLLKGNFAQASQDYAVAESIEPGLILSLMLKAQIEFFRGDYPAAEMTYRRLLTINRRGRVDYYSGISYLSALGYLRQQAGDAEESAALLREAATLHSDAPEGPQSIYDLAAVRAIEGKEHEALALLKQAITSGWMDYRATLLDPRFSSLRKTTDFQAIIAKLQVHVSAMRRESARLCSKSLDLADYPVQPFQ